MNIYIYIYTHTYIYIVVGLIVVVGATTVLKAMPRRVAAEDCSFQGILETTVRLCQW